MYMDISRGVLCNGNSRPGFIFAGALGQTWQAAQAGLKALRMIALAFGGG